MAHVGDHALVAALLAGDAAMVARFLARAEGPVWSAVVAIDGEGRRGEQSLELVFDALRADGWARLRPYDGRSSLPSFLTLLTREIIASDIIGGLAERPQWAWRRFEALFARDIRRRIARRFPRADEAERQDLYQDICLALVDRDYRRLRQFKGTGGLIGFVLVTVDRLLLDLIRQQAGRPRLPAAVERMTALEQELFRLIAWREVPCEVARLRPHLARRFPGISDADLTEATRRVSGLAIGARGGRVSHVSLDEPDPLGLLTQLVAYDLDPAEHLAEQQRASAHQALIAAVRQAADGLGELDRAYLAAILSASDPLPPREIAVMLGVAIEELRLVQQRVKRRLDTLAETHKNLFLSVYGGEEFSEP